MAGVNTLFFRMKRAYHACLAFSRRTLAPAGLTPARFDILALLEIADGSMDQGLMTRALGLTRSVVSRMLQRMGELGLVERTIDPKDRRKRIVSLSDDGWRALLDTYEKVDTLEVSERVAARVFAPWGHAHADVWKAVRRFEQPLTRMRYLFGDMMPAGNGLVPMSPPELRDVPDAW